MQRNNITQPVKPQNPLDMPVTMTCFPDEWAKTKSELILSLRGLGDLIQRTVAWNKEALPWFKMAAFGNDPSLSPSGTCLRCDDNVLSVTGVEADYDSGEMTPKEAEALLSKYRIAALIYTSPSHQKPGKGNRWRVFCVFSRPLTPDQRYRIMARLNGVLGGVLDPASFTLSQAFYGGHESGQPKPLTILVAGRFIDLADDLDAVAIGKPGRAVSATGGKGALDQKALKAAIISGENYHGSAIMLCGLWLKNGKSYRQIEEDLTALFQAVDDVQRDSRWRDRVKSIPEIISRFMGSDAKRATEERDRLLADFDDLMTEDEDLSAEELKAIEELAGPGSTPVKPSHAAQPNANLRSAFREAADKAAALGDVANGAAHANRVRGRVIFVSATVQHVAWTGQRWAAQTAEDVMADAKETTAHIFADAARAVKNDPSDRNRQLLQKASALHGSATAISRMEAMSRSEPGMSVVSPAEFDRDPDILTLPNGILDLRTATLRDAVPQDRVSRLGGCAYEPYAKAPMFMDFLDRVLPDEQVREFVRRAIGYTLTGSVEEEKFFMCHGVGANGKSTFANIIAAMIGEYGGSFGAALVTRNKNENEAARMIARLPGVRLALVNETAIGDLWDSARLKELASRERIAARLLYKEGFDFFPTHKLWIRTNHLPGSLDAGDGFWRRCIPIPFTVQIPEADLIRDLDNRIIATELPGVLNWALQGAMEWAKGGLAVPAVITKSAQSYREETDVLGLWMDERTKPDAKAKVPVREAFADYEDFCQSQGMSAGSAMTFSRAMTDRGAKRDSHKGGGRRFIGFRLVERSHMADGFDLEDWSDVEALI
jgi:putative DNA primase/helicase